MPDGQRQAVIVGINEYQDKSIPKLTGSVNDATEMYQRLKDFGDFEITDGHYLTGEKATSKAVRKAISDLLWQVDPCDLALFYFSGHGIIDGRKNGYIAPYDMVKDEPLVCGIGMEEFKRIILSSEQKSSVVVILDCCYSGITTKGAKGGEPMTFTFEQNFADLDKEKGGEGKIILASSGETEVSREMTECRHMDGSPPHPHGTFTYHLLEGLDGKAANEAGIITLDRLRIYVEGQLGNQKSNFFAAGASQIEKIIIAVASKQHEDFVKKKMEIAENLYKNLDMASLIKATKTTKEVLNINEKISKALELKNKISDTLNNYQSAVLKWITIYEQDIRPSIPNAFPKIEKLNNYLDFDKIVTLDQERTALLILLCRVSKNEDIDNDEFIKRCKQSGYDNPSASSTQVAGVHK